MHRVGTGRLLGAQEKRLVELIDSEGMAEDLKEVKWMEISFADLKQDELTHWEEVVGRYFLKHTKSELYNSAIEKGIMLAPIFDIKDICEYQQLQSRGYWIEKITRLLTQRSLILVLYSSQVKFPLTSFIVRLPLVNITMKSM